MLELLTQKGAELTILDYLKTPPSHEELEALLKKLEMSPLDLIRKKEAIFKELSLGDSSKSREELINAMVSHPKLLERPIFVVGDRAKIGRPPEQVLELLN